MIYASWLMYREGPTISRIQLEKLFNRTQETIRRWERDRLQSIINIRPNYAQLHDPRAIDFTPPEDRFTYLAEVRTSTGTYIVERLSWRLPASECRSAPTDSARVWPATGSFGCWFRAV